VVATDAQLPQAQAAPPAAAREGTWPTAAGGLARVLALAVAYYAAGQASLALQYTGPVAAIWLPVGVGAAALYLGGLRWWPGVLIGDLALADSSQPLATALGVTVGNVLDILVIAVLLRRLLGPRSALDRVEHVGGMLVAITAGAAVTATVAVVSLRAGGVIGSSDLPSFWRSWFLADASGALVTIPLVLAWAGRPVAVRIGPSVWEGAAVIAAVVALSAIALSGEPPLTYLVFPPLIWAALRLGQRGATLAVAVAAGMTVGITANEMGAFVSHSITEAVLATQLYLAVAAVTTICLAAIVAERERSAFELAEAQRREGRRASEERQRIARDLHDSVSQTLFTTALHLRTARRALRREGMNPDGGGARELTRVEQLIVTALSEMRALVFELRPGAVADDGLVIALTTHAAAVSAREEITIAVHGPDERLPLPPAAEAQSYRICQEALANIVKHAHATEAAIDVAVDDGNVVIEIRDDGRGFAPSGDRTHGFGLRSMVARTSELGGRFEISSAPGHGTVVRVELPGAG
jgi:signal transduction histidine kinase